MAEIKKQPKNKNPSKRGTLECESKELYIGGEDGIYKCKDKKYCEYRQPLGGTQVCGIDSKFKTDSCGFAVRKEDSEKHWCENPYKSLFCQFCYEDEDGQKYCKLRED